MFRPAAKGSETDDGDFSMKNEAAVAGIGTTKFTPNSGVSELALACEAVQQLPATTRVSIPAEVDGLVTYTLESSDEVEVARAVGLGDLTTCTPRSTTAAARRSA
jgi:hypothetical protein